MKYLHTMVRVTDIEQSLRFYRDALGLKQLSRKDYPQGRYSLVFLAAPGDEEAQVELTHNWDPEEYSGGRNFGHLAYAVDNIYDTCKRLMDHGVTINRPPRDGRMAFVRSPDKVSSNCCRRVLPWHPRRHGPPCRTSASGRCLGPAIMTCWCRNSPGRGRKPRGNEESVASRLLTPS